MVRILLGLFFARPPLKPILHNHLLKLIPPLGQRNKRNMASNSVCGGGGGGEGGGARDPSLNPKVAKLRQVFTHDSSSSASTDSWEKCWEEGVTPWDLGQATPVVLHLLQTGTLPKGHVLVPGCGTGYDVVAMASTDRHVLGLDISSSAVRKAKEWSSSLPNANYFNFLAEDFFTWQPSELFDLVFDYTFFCAIDPCMRSSWAKKMSDILKPDGELITLVYMMNDQEGGPPYNNSVADYEEVLNLVGFTAVSIVDNKLAVAPRRGKEKLGRWKRSLHYSSL